MQSFLAPQELRLILEWALASRAQFRPAKVIGGIVDPAKRVAMTLRELGPMDAVLRRALRAALPWVFANTGTQPFEPKSIELEVAAHGHGAHFSAHRDIPVGSGRLTLGGEGSGTQDRVLSSVLYFYKEPKGFSGGELRLHRFGSDGLPDDYVDLQPLQNSLVVFPSWATHEVRPITSSGSFDDSRFAVNCWFCREWPRSVT